MLMGHPASIAGGLTGGPGYHRRMNLLAVQRVTSGSMRGRSILAALLLMAAISGCTQPAPGGGGESEAPPSVDQPEASATPYLAPGDY